MIRYAALLAIMATSARPDTLACQPRDDLAQTLLDKWGETSLFTGLAADQKGGTGNLRPARWHLDRYRYHPGRQGLPGGLGRSVAGVHDPAGPGRLMLTKQGFTHINGS